MPDPSPARTGVQPGLSKQRLGFAFVIAAISDAASVGTQFAPPLQLGVDVTTALLLLLILGRRWQLLPPLIVEAIPGLALFPTWIAAMIAIVGFLPREQPPAGRVIDVTPPRRDEPRR
jgi:hypothetical protein